RCRGDDCVVARGGGIDAGGGRSAPARCFPIPPGLPYPTGAPPSHRRSPVPPVLPTGVTRGPVGEPLPLRYLAGSGPRSGPRVAVVGNGSCICAQQDHRAAITA